MDFKEGDLEHITEKHKKVTYKQIQEYIEKEHGVKVHSSYIAEVKRKHGLDVKDYKRLPDEELKNPRKLATSKKVKLIEDALRHFGILEE